MHFTSEADDAKVLPSADDPEQADSTQSWPGFFWLPPADDNSGECDMLHLDDELAGLIDAADTAAGQDGAPTTKPEPALPVPGEDSVEQNQSSAVPYLCNANSGSMSQSVLTLCVATSSRCV